MPADLSLEKRALRAELRERRRNLTSTERTAAATGITERLIALAESVNARSVSCYLSATDEPDTRGFLRWASHEGIRALLPIARTDGLLDWVVASDDDEIAEGMFGLPEPTGEVLGPIAVNDVDLMIIPAAAVDRAGMRMGWGRGYFDKTIGSMEKCPPVYAVIYDSEILDSLPREVHDQPVNGVVTPTQTLELSPTRR